jgi:hypothetical protein
MKILVELDPEQVIVKEMLECIKYSDDPKVVKAAKKVLKYYTMPYTYKELKENNFEE